MRINTYISPLCPASALLVAVHLLLPSATASILNLGAEQIVQAGGANLSVPGHSVPAFVDWNNDGLGDLIVGQGNGTYPPGKLRVYVNTGAPADPQFSSYFFAQSNGADLTVPASGCLGLFGRTTYWDADGRKDLARSHGNCRAHRSRMAVLQRRVRRPHVAVERQERLPVGQPMPHQDSVVPRSPAARADVHDLAVLD